MCAGGVSGEEASTSSAQAVETLPDTHSEPLQDLANQADSSEKQGAAVALAMPEAHSLQGDISSELCGVMKSSEVKLTMPCALSDSLEMFSGVTEVEQLPTVAKPTPQPPETTKAGQKTKKARKRAKKNRKGEANAVDMAEVEER